MSENYQSRFEKMKRFINGIKKMSARVEGDKAAWTREQKMPLKDMIYSILGLAARADFSGMYDVLNRFFVDIGIPHYRSGEREEAKEHFERMRGISLRQCCSVGTMYRWSSYIFWRRAG